MALSVTVATVKVEGLNELRAAFRHAPKDLKGHLRAANKAGASVVAARARQIVPERGGRLKRSIAEGATLTAATVKAGTVARVPYAGPVHFGWARRGIRPQPFLYRALSERHEAVVAAYEKQLNELAADLSTR